MRRLAGMCRFHEGFMADLAADLHTLAKGHLFSAEWAAISDFARCLRGHLFNQDCAINVGRMMLSRVLGETGLISLVLGGNPLAETWFGSSTSFSDRNVS